MQLTNSDKGILLLAARESILSLFRQVPRTTIEYSEYPNLLMKAGAFVTLTIGGQLRGCIGYLSSENAIFDTVCDAAQQAATNDPRFSPLTLSEMEHVNIEISVLTPPQPIRVYEDIIIGQHGLILEEPQHRGVLLPQVAVDHNLTTAQFLSALCEKAGMDSFAWRERMLNINVFGAIVFSEIGKRKRTYGG
ncbi:MAG: AmmeMemoRadiSam system protein A [Ignavibacteriaceae bacterium]|nr:AmmeMemoRadiSam system protein A [Ignavibacteriaceae bacterium]